MAVYTFVYDTGYYPAAPVVDVTLISPETDKTSAPITALVDSGSDGSVMPLELLDEINALSMGTAVMSGIWGDRRRVNLYLVTMKIGDHLIRGIHVAGIPDRSEAVIGRNAMNTIALVLNGPAHMVEILGE